MRLFRPILPVAVLLFTVAAAPPADDPYLWLEEIQGERALTQVKEWNAEAEAALTKMPRYEEYRKRARALFDDEQHIAAPEDVLHDEVTNKWRDARHPHGRWRTASPEYDATGHP